VPLFDLLRGQRLSNDAFTSEILAEASLLYQGQLAPAMHGRKIISYQSLSKWAQTEVAGEIRNHPDAIIVHHADEKLRHHRRNYGRNLVIRSYFSPFLRNRFLFIPSGFNPDLVSEIRKISLQRQRKNLVSFAGSMKNNRHEMIDVFRQCNEAVFAVGGAQFLKDMVLSNSELADLMSQSYFTLCPFGSKSAETWRVLEALEAGSIPVQVRFLGHDYSSVIFGHHPFIVENTWEDALAVVLELSKDKGRLQRKQEEVADFYRVWRGNLAEDFCRIGMNGRFKDLVSPQFRIQRRVSQNPVLFVRYFWEFKVPENTKLLLRHMRKRLFA
jgi:hypothetical protein